MHSGRVLAVALAAISVSLCASDGWSKPRPDLAEDAYSRCISKPDLDNLGYGHCGGLYVDGEEARLNALWRKLVPKLDAQSRVALLAEERAWVAYKDLSCNYYQVGDFGREAQVFGWANCRAGVIAARVKNLEGIYSDVVGETGW